MSQYNVGNTRTTDMSNTLENFSVAALTPEGATGADETEWINTKWNQWFGYYKKIPELKRAIDAKAVWTVGRGFTADPEITVILDHIQGNGLDTFNTILKNMIITMHIGGDAFCEIIRDGETGELINIKPLDPGSIKIIFNKEGIVKRYEQVNKIPNKAPVVVKFNPNEILHFSKDRVADEIHGTSVVESVEETILRRNEAMTDMRTLMHRNVKPVVTWEVDTDDTGKMAEFQNKVDEALKKAENLVIPKESAKWSILSVPPNATLNPMPWIEYNEDFFYKAVGVPSVILGGSKEFTEATAKISYLVFEQEVKDSQMYIESQMWQQLAMRIDLETPTSLKNELLQSESKNTGQVGFQPNEVNAATGQ